MSETTAIRITTNLTWGHRGHGAVARMGHRTRVAVLANMRFAVEMTSPILASPLAGKTIGSRDDNFVIAGWQDKGGLSEQPRFIAPLHLHHRHDEAWYVIEGVLGGRNGVRSLKPALDRVCSCRGAAYLLESGAKSGAVFARYDLQHLWTDRGYSRFGGMTPGVFAAAFRKHDSELLSAWIKIRS